MAHFRLANAHEIDALSAAITPRVAHEIPELAEPNARKAALVRDGVAFLDGYASGRRFGYRGPVMIWLSSQRPASLVIATRDEQGAWQCTTDEVSSSPLGPYTLRAATAQEMTSLAQEQSGHTNPDNASMTFLAAGYANAGMYRLGLQNGCALFVEVGDEPQFLTLYETGQDATRVFRHHARTGLSETHSSLEALSPGM